ncbi:hypothetical protein Peur_064216 [Populus x canadensis]
MHALHTCVVCQHTNAQQVYYIHSWDATMATSTSITGVLQSFHKHRGDSWSFHVIGKLLNDEQIKRK